MEPKCYLYQQNPWAHLNLHGFKDLLSTLVEEMFLCQKELSHWLPSEYGKIQIVVQKWLQYQITKGDHVHDDANDCINYELDS